jgi:hypothetical protein
MNELQAKLARRRTLNNESAEVIQKEIKKTWDVQAELAGTSVVQERRSTVVDTGASPTLPTSAAKLAKQQQEYVRDQEKKTKERMHTTGGEESTFQRKSNRMVESSVASPAIEADFKCEEPVVSNAGNHEHSEVTNPPISPTTNVQPRAALHEQEFSGMVEVTLPLDPLLIESDEEDERPFDPLLIESDEEDERTQETEQIASKPTAGGRRASQQTVIQGSADLQPFAEFQRQVGALNCLHTIHEETKGRLLERLTLISTRKQEIQLLTSKLAPEEVAKMFKAADIDKDEKSGSDSESDSDSDSGSDEAEEGGTRGRSSPLAEGYDTPSNLPLSPASRNLAGEDARKKSVQLERSARKKSSALANEMNSFQNGGSADSSAKNGKSDEDKCRRKLSVAQGLSTLQVSEMEHEIANLELKLKSTGKEVLELETRLAVVREYVHNQSNSWWGQVSSWVSSPQAAPNENVASVSKDDGKNYEDTFAEAVEDEEMDWKSVEAEAEKQRTLKNYTELRKVGMCTLSTIATPANLISLFVLPPSIAPPLSSLVSATRKRRVACRS